MIPTVTRITIRRLIVNIPKVPVSLANNPKQVNEKIVAREADEICLRLVGPANRPGILHHPKILLGWLEGERKRTKREVWIEAVRTVDLPWLLAKRRPSKIRWCEEVPLGLSRDACH